MSNSSGENHRTAGKNGRNPATGPDRRSGTDRRSGQDRRSARQSIDFPERRTGGDRRVGDRRRVPVEEAPLLEWESEAKGPDLKRYLPIMLSGLFAALLAVFLLKTWNTKTSFAQASGPDRRPARVQSIQPIVTRLQTEQVSAPVERRSPVAPPSESSRSRTITEMLTSLAPRIYRSVRLELVSEHSLSRSAGTVRDTRSLAVRTVEINVKTQEWDQLTGAARVSLLHKTFDTLRKRYPDITPLVRLNFDNGRGDLLFRFDSPAPQQE